MITTSKDCGARRMARRAPSWAMGLLLAAVGPSGCRTGTRLPARHDLVRAELADAPPVVTWFRTWASRSS